MLKIFIILIAFSMSLFAQDETITKLFPGKWKLEIENAEVYEEWNVECETELIGTSYYYENESKHILENLYIKKFADQWAYVALPEGQNITLFALTEFTSEKFVFENKEHDYPQKIVYNFVSNNKIEVTLDGIKGEEKKKIYLTFTSAN